MSKNSRREFLKITATGACAAGLSVRESRPAMAQVAPTQSAAPKRIEKGVVIDMLPKKLSYADRMKLLRDTGFDGVQANTTPDQREAEEIKKAAGDAGIKIDSVMNMDHWKYPLSSSDPAVVERSLEGMRTSMHNAKLWRAHTVLLVPAVVNEQTSYRDAWNRSQLQIRKLIPLAEELGVVIALEEVWNKFLLSPLEFAEYVDMFESPWVKAWFDVGNVVLYGYPQDWIRTLGNRMVDVHLKDFKRDGYQWVNLGEGSVNWPEVKKAFVEVGYHGFAIAELEGGDEAYLRDLSRRIDRLLLA